MSQDHVPIRLLWSNLPASYRSSKSTIELDDHQLVQHVPDLVHGAVLGEGGVGANLKDDL